VRILGFLQRYNDDTHHTAYSVRYLGMNVQTEPAREAGLQLQPAGSPFYPTAMNDSTTTSNSYVPNHAHDDMCVFRHCANVITRLMKMCGCSVQYLQPNTPASLVHHTGLEACGSPLVHPLQFSPPIIHDVNHDAFIPSPIQGNRSRPLTILDRYKHFYPCQWLDGNQSCGYMIQDDARQMLSHLKIHHGLDCGPRDSCYCFWQDCSMHVKHNNLARHLTTHLGIKIRCLNCSTEVTRPDCARAHQNKRRFCSEATFQVIPGPSAHTFT
jgi:hypothetical protein